MSDQERLVAGRYRLLERIGRGGMGTVWRAEDQLLGRQVAVKKLHVPHQASDDERATLYERTRREARSAARIAHPNVVVVHDVVEDEGLPCVVMEYVRSRTLSEVLKEDGPLSLPEAVRVGRGMLAALRAAHAAGVLHRDVKPANVLLEGGFAAAEDPAADGRGASGADGGGRAHSSSIHSSSIHSSRGNDSADPARPGRRVVLTDFGIAFVPGTSTLTRTGELVGSFDYLAPERIRGGSPGPASDLWSLGATLYQALEGKPPFHRPTPIETAYAIAAEDHEPPRNAGPLAPLIQGLLAKDADRRMTAEQAERLLTGTVDTVLGGGALPAAPGGGGGAEGTTAVTRRAAARARAAGKGEGAGDGTGPGRGRQGRRRPALWIAAALIVAGVAGTAAWNLGGGDSEAAGRPDPSASASAPASANGTPAKTKASPTRSALPPAPSPEAGYRSVSDPLGFSVTVPQDWTRGEADQGLTANYTDPTGTYSLRFSVLDFADESPYEHWRSIEPEVEAKSPGYERLRLNATRFQDRPAAMWEFSWDASERWRALDLGFVVEGQREYAVYLSAPNDDWAFARRFFDTAAESFRVDG